MAYSYGAVTVATTATQVLPPNGGRRGFVIRNNGGVVVYLGFDSSVTTATGMPVMPQDTYPFTGEQSAFKGAIWGVAASSTADVRFWDYTP